MLRHIDLTLSRKIERKRLGSWIVKRVRYSWKFRDPSFAIFHQPRLRTNSAHIGASSEEQLDVLGRRFSLFLRLRSSHKVFKMHHIEGWQFTYLGHGRTPTAWAFGYIEADLKGPRSLMTRSGKIVDGAEAMIGKGGF